MQNNAQSEKTKYIQTANFLYYFIQNLSSILSYLHFAAGNNVQIQQQTLEQNVIYTTKQNSHQQRERCYKTIIKKKQTRTEHYNKKLD